MRALITKYNAGRALRAPPAVDDQGVPLARTQSRAASIHESMYGNRVSFIKRAQRTFPLLPRRAALMPSQAPSASARRCPSPQPSSLASPLTKPPPPARRSRNPRRDPPSVSDWNSTATLLLEPHSMTVLPGLNLFARSVSLQLNCKTFGFISSACDSPGVRESARAHPLLPINEILVRR